MSVGKLFQPGHVSWSHWVIVILISAPTQLLAQDEVQAPPEIPPIEAKLPPKIQEEQIEPTVTIREEEVGRVEEYSLNGQVYMVKITPKIGVPYYFIDSDGDGRLEDTPNKGLDPVKPVHWKIKEWQ